MKIKNIYILLFLLVLWGCSTKKNTPMRRGYHNLTAHYNVYFNGNESFKDGVKAIEENNEDDYTQILPVFPDSKPGSESVAGSQMDRAIEKGTKLIQKHSIRKKPEKKRDDQSIRYKRFLAQNEFNKWVDNAYLMIGKSHFYKKEFYIAQQSFGYMFREFRVGPEWYEAEIWSARIAIEQGDFAKAKILLENYDLESKAPSSLYGFYAAAHADYFIRQGMYADAIPFLKEAVGGAWSKYYKRRFNFILAQLYHKQGQYTEASQAYEAVIKSNPPYEMAFNAKVNRAGILFEEGGLEAVKKEIKKLLRDKRNVDYEDQIYYALAMAYKAEEQEVLAMDNFLLSIERSVDNDHQKGMSFYEMSEIYYEKPEYKPAYYYLDSAVFNLNETYPGMDVLKELHGSLGDLVSNIEIVEREDSLLKVAKMPEKEQLALIDKLIEEEKKRQEELKQAEEQASGQGDMFFDPSLTQSTGNSSQAGNWYFYNQASVGMGKMEFEKKWGRRKNEDNWRRKNKQVVVQEEQDLPEADDVFAEDGDLPNDSTANEALAGAAKKESENDPLKRGYYLKDIPNTQEQQAESHKQIQEGLINQGMIYKDELENIPYAIECFRRYVQSYNDGSYLEDAYMNLYLCYEKQDDGVKMQEIRGKLTEKFPDGEFTAFLNDPDYFEKREAREKKVEALYEQAYADYLFNDFAASVGALRQVLEIDDENPLVPKFKFLAGLSCAKMGDLSKFESELTEVKDNYPDSEVTPLAIEMLKQYAEGRTPVKGAVTSNLIAKRKEEFSKEQQARGNDQVAGQVATSFTVDHKSQHGLIILVNPEADINRLKFNIADYNFSKFLLNDYEMSSAKLPDGTPVFSVSGFNNRIEALDYFYSIRERNDIFEVDKLEYKHLYVIHDKNMEYLLSSGDKTGYDAFFAENYLSAEAFKNLREERLQAEKEAREAEALKKEEAEKAKVEELVEQKKQTVKEEPEQKVKTEPEKPKVVAPIVEKPATDRTKTQEKQEVQSAKVKKEEPAQKEVVEEKKEEVLEEVKEKEQTKEIPMIEKPSNNFVKEEGEHTAMILFKKARMNTDRIALVFKNYTKSNYGGQYTTESNKVATDYFMIKVKGFANDKEAKAYLDKVNLNSFLMREISRVKHYLLPITPNNLGRLTDEESFEVYNNFYKSNY